MHTAKVGNAACNLLPPWRLQLFSIFPPQKKILVWKSTLVQTRSWLRSPRARSGTPETENLLLVTSWPRGDIHGQSTRLVVEQSRPWAAPHPQEDAWISVKSQKLYPTFLSQELKPIKSARLNQVQNWDKRRISSHVPELLNL